ncbi:hydrophobin [Hygrophoropsis aurantiaca]|uniref:Hydrophobin n=1 Tax=Hygrophoropsis aurantiaca TaxID=72124 RepID=A0ACB8A2B6_9AGAM|nr:hydrophobin [Hygrophoropsis aurantiaca]
MFARISTLFVALALGITVLAGQCNTGPVYCCKSVQQANSPQVAKAASLLGIVLGATTGQVGLGCDPITVTGTGQGATCSSDPICCHKNEYNGALNIGCSPINAAA